MKLMQLLFVSAALCGIVHPSSAAPVCPDTDACITAVLASVRAGDHASEVAQMSRLHRLVPDWRNAPKKPASPRIRDETIGIGAPGSALESVLKNGQQAYPDLIEYQRALALHYLQQKQYQAAETEAKKGIAQLPSYAPFWSDLAAIYAAKGLVDEAATALVVAHNWALDAGAMRQAYATAAQAPEYGAAYRQALTLLDRQAAALAQLEAATPQRGADGKPVARKDVQGPTMSNCPTPVWPKISLRYEETGDVKLALLISAEGQVLRAKKLSSTGYSELDNAGLTAIADCKFTPGKQNGVAVPAWFVMAYAWTLN